MLQLLVEKILKLKELFESRSIVRRFEPRQFVIGEPISRTRYGTPGITKKFRVGTSNQSDYPHYRVSYLLQPDSDVTNGALAARNIAGGSHRKDGKMA